MKKKILLSFIHLAVWGLLLGGPLFFPGKGMQPLIQMNYLRFIVAPISFIFLYYINYYGLIRLFLEHKQMARFVVSNIILITAMMLFVHCFHQIFPLESEFTYSKMGRESVRVLPFTLRFLPTYVLVIALSVAIHMTEVWYNLEAKQQKQKASHSEAEIQNLKSQLNPHFLFNTLNNIYSLIAISPQEAQHVVLDLSALLRYVLYGSSQQFVPLLNDVNFVCDYVKLMRIRLAEHVKVTVDIGELPDVQIAPLLFISLVENAFKHGISNTKPSFIEISIQRKENSIACSIRNSSFQQESKQDCIESGIGFENLRKRLELIYPNKHLFSYGKENDTFCSLLIINFDENKA